ncbi:LPS assembly lipoprotein LptE [bacterium]|nr:LPS assembly lipoprotein LptE [bacterium]
MNRALFPVVILIAAMALAGCERIAPVRTLPNWVQGVYIPIVKNTSFEPGIEEDATRKIQEAFMQDGRVNVVPKSSADLILQVEISDWIGRTTGTAGDDIADRTQYNITVKVQLFEPYSDQPRAVLLPILIEMQFNTDARSIDYVQLPDRQERILETVAQRVVQSTITGYPAQAR